MIRKVSREAIAFDPRAMGEWCQQPFPGYPNGCPSYGKRETCPPNTQPYYKLIDPPYYLVAQSMNLKEARQDEEKIPPRHREKQVQGYDHWFPILEQTVLEEAKKFILTQSEDYMVIICPSAVGIDIFQTCQNIGISLDKNPKGIFWKIAVLGKKVNPSH